MEPARDTWLCSSDLERERLLDMDVRSRSAMVLGFGAWGVALVVVHGTTGWWPIVMAALAGSIFAVTAVALRRVRRPEYWLLTADVAAIWLVGAAAVLMTGGANSSLLPVFMLPLAAAPSRQGPRGVLVTAVSTAAALLVSTSGIRGTSVLDHPEQVVTTLAAMAGVAAFSIAAMRSDVLSRTTSVLDPLTGALNRRSLESRFEELRQQAQLTNGPVSVVMCDLDHFKAVNDQHGHQRGDAALKDAVYTMRKSLRSFESIYRLGGEEFLVLLPGANSEDAASLAEKLRAAIQDAEPAGLRLTVSIGVCTREGRAVDLEAMAAEVDAALYTAKASGRNQVAVARPAPMLLVPSG